ncbi:MAG: chaperone protein, partial [Methanosarcina sp.]
MVADKFTVESRRKTFEDELNPSIPIYFEIPTAYDYFVKRQSKRSKYGTKITLNLKSDHPFSSSSLIEKISEIAPFIEYQIIVKTNNETKLYEPLLPGDIYGDTPNLKIYFGVTFNELDKS